MNTELFSSLLSKVKGINISSIISGTNKTLKTVKKAIPIYKEVRPYLKKEKKLFDKEELLKKDDNIKEKEYDDSLTFFN